MLAAMASSAALLGGCADDEPTRIGSSDGRADGLAIPSAQVSADGLEVTVSATPTTPCATLAVEAVEEDEQVELVLTEQRSADVCGLLLAQASATVALEEPLGERALVDASTGEPVPYFDPRTLAEVGGLPDGYEPFREYVSLERPRDGSDRVVFLSLRSFTDPTGRGTNIEISQTQVTGPALTRLPRTGRLRHAGSSIDVHSDDTGIALVWELGDQRLAVASASFATDPRPLSRRELLAIVDGTTLP